MLKKAAAASVFAAFCTWTAGAQTPCESIIDKSRETDWDQCGTKSWELQFDVYTRGNNTPSGQYSAGYAVANGTCKGGFIDCSGSWILGSIDKASKQFNYRIWPEDQAQVWWMFTEKFSRVENCVNNPEWFNETLWSSTFTSGWSYVYCN